MTQTTSDTKIEEPTNPGSIREKLIQLFNVNELLLHEETKWDITPFLPVLALQSLKEL